MPQEQKSVQNQEKNNMKNKYAKLNMSKGFTLIELLVVIGILAILLAITLIAINPAKQFSAANNTKRSSDVNAILNAIDQNAIDNKGVLPASLAASCTATACEITGVTAVGNIDLCPSLVTQYLAALPEDPLNASGAPVIPCNATYDSGYKVQVNAPDNRVIVSAPKAENGAVISVTR